MTSVRVLLVHDQSLIRESLRLLIESTGEITVAAAVGDGRQAVRLLPTLKPEVIVVGITTPELHGIVAARKIRDAFPRLDIVVLLLLSAPDYLRQLLADHGLGHVIQASNSAELIEAIRAVHEGRPHAGLRPRPPGARYRPPLHATGRTSPLRLLSRREREVLRLVIAGSSSKEIASRLRIATSTVDTYRGRIMEKFGVDSLAALIKFALENDISPLV